MKTTKLLGAKILIGSLAVVVCLGIKQAAVSGPPATAPMHAESVPDPIVMPQDAKQIELIRKAGLHRDNTKIAFLINSLNRPPHPYYKKTALHSLARLGAPEAIAAIDNTIRNGDADTSRYAKVSKARLLTENALGDSFGVAGTSSKVERFCKELGETPEQINAAVEAHYYNGGGSTGPQPVEVYALREIADMVYSDAKDSGEVVSTLPNVPTLNFRRDPPALLKMKVSALPAAARLSSLIQDLSRKKTLGPDDYFEMQLVADEGLPASRAAAAQLTKMGSNKGQFTTEGLVAMLQVIYGVGDRTQAPVFARLMADANVEFMYPDVKNGVPHQIVPGY